MEQIRCQGKHDENGGCYTCGGFGHIVEWVSVCDKCKVKAWVRPGNFTCYHGKTYNSFDGMKITHYFVDGKWCRLCRECDEKAKENGFTEECL